MRPAPDPLRVSRMKGILCLGMETFVQGSPSTISPSPLPLCKHCLSFDRPRAERLMCCMCMVIATAAQKHTHTHTLSLYFLEGRGRGRVVCSEVLLSVHSGAHLGAHGATRPGADNDNVEEFRHGCARDSGAAPRRDYLDLYFSGCDESQDLDRRHDRRTLRIEIGVSNLSQLRHMVEVG